MEGISYVLWKDESLSAHARLKFTLTRARFFFLGGDAIHPASLVPADDPGQYRCPGAGSWGWAGVRSREIGRQKRNPQREECVV